MTKKLRVNQEIRVPTVRLIDGDESQIGVISIEEALKIAQERGIDLVEVSPLGNPPVCKLMDYGKFLYRQNKIEQKHKRMQKKSEIKGIRVSFNTDRHDMAVKAASARKFLKDKDIIKISLIFKGREGAHLAIAQEKLLDFATMLADIAKIEQAPKRQGNTLMMILIPHNKPPVVDQPKEQTPPPPSQN